MLIASIFVIFITLGFWVGYRLGYKAAYLECTDKLEALMRRFGWTS